MKHIIKVMALGLLFLFSACSDDTKLTLSKHELTIKEGEKVQIEVSVEPEKLLNDVLWESSLNYPESPTHNGGR